MSEQTAEVTSGGAVHTRRLEGEARSRGGLRVAEDENRFISIGPWESLEAIEAWRGLEGFNERVARMRELLVSFEPTTLEPVVERG